MGNGVSSSPLFMIFENKKIQKPLYFKGFCISVICGKWDLNPHVVTHTRT